MDAEFLGFGQEEEETFPETTPELPQGTDRDPSTPVLEVIQGGRSPADQLSEIQYQEPEEGQPVADLVQDTPSAAAPTGTPIQDELFPDVNALIQPEPLIRAERLQEIIDARLGPGAFEQIDEESFAGLQAAIERGDAEGITPEDVTRAFAFEVQKAQAALEKERAWDERIARLEYGHDPEAAALARAEERARAESEAWAADQQAQLTVAFEDRNQIIQERGGKPLDPMRVFATANRLGLLGTVPPEQAIDLALAHIALSGDVLSHFTPQKAPEGVERLIGRGPTAQRVMPVLPSNTGTPMRPQRTIADILDMEAP